MNDWYEHEREEKVVVRTRPLSTSYPVLDVDAHDLMEIYLANRRLDSVLAVANGWYGSRTAGDDEPRIVIPASSEIPGNCFWQARAMGSSTKRYQSPHAPRADALVALHPKRWNERIVVAEGPMDALAAAMQGFKAVALMGITPSDEVLGHLKSRLRGFHTILVADGDQPGGMAKILSKLVAYGCKAPLTLVSAYPYKDLAEAPLAERERILAIG